MKTIDKAIRMCDVDISKIANMIRKYKNDIDYIYAQDGEDIPKNPYYQDCEYFIDEFDLNCSVEDFRKAWKIVF